MTIGFAIIAMLIIAGAVAAVSLRNLVHCALALVVTFAGLALVYLQLEAQFVGFTQLLVYVGAVAILIVFAILLTRGGDAPEQNLFSTSWIAGLGVTFGVLAVLTYAIAKSSVGSRGAPVAVDVATRGIGNALMTRFVMPFEVVGLLLTAALIGAVIIAMREKK